MLHSKPELTKAARGASRMHAILSALSLPACVLSASPYAEMGLEDDWSYARTTQILAQTGHVVYNGWATAMLGWQLYWGALFVRIFGFSFSTLRFSTLVLGMLTVFLFHRCLVRCGLSESNATMGALALALSPLTMALSFTFMTDMAALLCIVAAFYACLRALQSEDRRALAWLTAGTAAGLAGGTVRQIAWLSALIMVPSTVWMMRRRSGVRILGAVLFAVSLSFVLAVLQWFHAQPYSLTEKLLPVPLGRASAAIALIGFVRAFLGLPLLLLPMLLPFLAMFPRKSKPALFGGAGLATFCLAAGVFAFHRHKLYVWVTPYTQNVVTSRGLLDVPILVGIRPVVLHTGVRVLLTLLTFSAAYSCLTFLWTQSSALRGVSRAQGEPAMGRRGGADWESSHRLSWTTLVTLIGPFSLIYLLFLVPRAAAAGMLDRYLLPVIAVCIVGLARGFQELVPASRASRLRVLSLVGVGVFAVYGVAAMHDLFQLYRARIAAIQEPLAAGVPRAQIGGGFEYDDWTELEIAGHVNEPRIEKPADAYQAPAVPRGTQPCSNEKADLVPHVIPRYILSFDPNACAGTSQFAPVVYRGWLIRGPVKVYILRTFPPAIPNSSGPAVIQR